jgi:aryl-alcohol dehydrogenase-like predicted oxidoreductase
LDTRRSAAARPQVSSVISGATSVEHVQANAAGGDWALVEEEIIEVNAFLDN